METELSGSRQCIESRFGIFFFYIHILSRKLHWIDTLGKEAIGNLFRRFICDANGVSAMVPVWHGNACGWGVRFIVLLFYN